ncbi:glycosyltransferase family 39 protein [Haloplanus aerogenes]|uniref:Dolichyl-phosphate-mannose-protein mannosyltransferase n=1 Tax=Haloplanus aerogenes TaxID=660522 RepID=A0A3M0DRK4_9EURY|nr:glycosyltransferase family 39 protein [Haloplanus aerogenes]AZH26468.1 phospholipid carrier-dependent glycosyltransferase [Haloplanus aerogenes]RMB18063.1 dolichyl-phosphate-mannose-protein mannosyltransferase [Haloplanus aerogenes]
MDIDRREATVVGSLISLGAALRVFRIGTESLWLDEAASVSYVTTMSVRELVVRIPWTDNSPPLYYLLLDAWTELFGVSEASVRLLSAVFGILSIPLLYLIGKRLFGERVGLLSAGILALSPFQLWYAQEARAYSLLLLLSLLSYYYFLRVDGDGTAADTVGYVVFSVLLGYTHVFGFFVILAQSLYVLLRYVPATEGLVGEEVVAWIKHQSLIGLLLSPYVVVLLVRIVAEQGDVWVSMPTLRSIVAAPVVYFGTTGSVRRSIPINLLILAVLGGLTLLSLTPLLRQLRAGEWPSPDTESGYATLNALLWFLVPIVVPIVLSVLLTPIYLIRYTIPASAGLYLLVAKGIETIPRRNVRLVAAGLIVLTLVQPLPILYADDQKEQWREAAHAIESNADEGDLIVISATYVQTPFEYYYEGKLAVVPVEEDVSATALRSNTRGHDTVWLITSHVKDHERERLRDLLDDDYVRVDEIQLNRIRIQKFSTASA